MGKSLILMKLEGELNLIYTFSFGIYDLGTLPASNLWNLFHQNHYSILWWKEETEPQTIERKWLPSPSFI